MNTKPLIYTLWLFLIIMSYTSCSTTTSEYTHLDSWYDSLPKEEQKLYQKAIYQLDEQAKQDTIMNRSPHKSSRIFDTAYLGTEHYLSPSDTLEILSIFKQDAYWPKLLWNNKYYDIRKFRLDTLYIPYFDTDTSYLIGIDIYKKILYWII